MNELQIGDRVYVSQSEVPEYAGENGIIVATEQWAGAAPPIMKYEVEFKTGARCWFLDSQLTLTGAETSPQVRLRSFEEGQIVRIRDVISTKRTGHCGQVVAIKRSRFGKSSLDKYTVRFTDGKEEEFWQIQLEKYTESKAIP